MCKIFQNTIIKKILIILLVILLIVNIFPNKVHAFSILKSAGGVIINAILDFFVFLGDTVLDILQNNFISTDDIVIQAESKDFSSVSGWDVLLVIVGVLLVIASIVVAIVSWGTLSWASFAGVMAGIKFIGGVVLATISGSIMAVKGTINISDSLAGKFDLPMIRYTPYEIFSNQIPVFDINFISPMESIVEKTLDSKLKLYIEILFSGKYEYDTELIFETDNFYAVYNEMISKSESLKLIVYDDGNEYHKDSRFISFIYLQEDSNFSEDEKNNIRKFLQHYDGKSNSFAFLIIWENEDLELNVLEIADTVRYWWNRILL